MNHKCERSVVEDGTCIERVEFGFCGGGDWYTNEETTEMSA